MSIEEGLKAYITSGQYFADARKWYNYKYLSPVTHKIWAIYAILILAFMLTTLGFSINKLLPIKQTISYGISVEAGRNEAQESAEIIQMDDSSSLTPVQFVAKTLLSNYLINREGYSYDNLTKQFVNVKNASTRIVFKRFYDYMSIDNADSPVIRYQKYATRIVMINNVTFTSHNDVIMNFTSVAKDSSDKIFENLKWEAHISFNMGDMKTKLPQGSMFGFTVTDYRLKLLGAKQ